MDAIINEVLINLEYVGIGLALFLISYIANMAFGIWYNIQVLSQEWDWDKIKASAIKVVAFIIGTTLMSVGVTTIPIFCNYIGLTIPEEFASVFEKLAIVGVFIYAACKYLTDAFDKFKKLLGQ